MTDSTGKKVKTYTYKVYGAIASQTGTFTQPYTFTAREYDPETGLYFYRARYYDPNVGRFISEDPIDFAGGDVNLFGYVGNDPINWIDPDGLLAYYYHYWITFIASLNSGYSFEKSKNLALQTMLVDFEFANPGTQGTNCKATRQHGMAGTLGDSPIYQTYQQAIKSTNAYIQESIISGNFAGAIHASQDLTAPAHTGQRWEGFGINLDTFYHILMDTIPTPSTIYKAYKGTKNILK